MSGSRATIVDDGLNCFSQLHMRLQLFSGTLLPSGFLLQ
jgi:hypothetical protein